MEKKLWVVTHVVQREDSDEYYVIAVCDTFELAQAMMKAKLDKIKNEWSLERDMDDVEIVSAPGYSSISALYSVETDEMCIQELVLNSIDRI